MGIWDLDPMYVKSCELDFRSSSGLKQTSKLIYVKCYCKRVYIIIVLSFVSVSNVT
jgi:hypothetical protein